MRQYLWLAHHTTLKWSADWRGASHEYTYKSRTAANADCAAAPCPSYEIGFRLEGGTGGLAGGARTTTQNGLQ